MTTILERFLENISRRLSPRGITKKKAKTHTPHTRGANKNIRESPLLTHANKSSKTAAGVDHCEMIAIDDDVNSKYDNSRDREDVVGAGGGAGDEVNKLS